MNFCPAPRRKRRGRDAAERNTKMAKAKVLKIPARGEWSFDEVETDGEGEFLTAVDSKGKEYDLDSLHSRELAAAAAKKPPDQKPPAKKKRTAKKKGCKSKRK